MLEGVCVYLCSLFAFGDFGEVIFKTCNLQIEAERKRQEASNNSAAQLERAERSNNPEFRQHNTP